MSLILVCLVLNVGVNVLGDCSRFNQMSSPYEFIHSVVSRCLNFTVKMNSVNTCEMHEFVSVLGTLV